MSKNKKLTRSRSNRLIGGVLGGFAEYFGWDATLVRVIFVVVSFFSTAFPGILVYILAWILMPDAPTKSHYYSDQTRKDVTPDDTDRP